MKLKDFGFTDGINEVIGITFKSDQVNTAPLGIIVDDDESDRARVKLYTSHTRENIEREGILYTNVILDPIVFSISAFEDLDSKFFDSLNPPIIKNALSWCKFSAKLTGAFAELTLLDGQICGKIVRAYNRGFAALIEALIYATRYKIVEDKAKEFIENEIYRCKNIVMRCGSRREKMAFKILEEKLGVNF
ncbi:MAG: DUF447 family protein [Archaeoglobaceae archaeon]